MDINFLTSNVFSKVQKRANANLFSTNPINFKGGLEKDNLELSQEAQRQKRMGELNREIQNIINEEENLKTMLLGNSITSKEFAAKIKPLRSQLREKNRERKLLTETQNFLNSGIIQERPNTAFLYDPRLSVEEKKEILARHPEIKSMEQIAQEAGNPNAANLDALYYQECKMFTMDTFDSTRYIDISNPENIENYELLKSQLKGKIPLERIVSKSKSLIEMDTLRRMTRRGTLEPIKAINKKTGKPMTIYLVSDEILDKMDNFDTLFPKKSERYYKSLLRDPKEPLLVPITYLSKLGYGTPQEIYANYKKGYFQGIEKNLEKDGKKIKFVAINIASCAAENNLETMKRQNKNYFTPKQLAAALHVSLSEIEKAVINGDLKATNEFIFSRPSYGIGIDLNNPQNEEYASKLAFIRQTEEELLQIKQENKEKNKTIFGLKSKIAWFLSPETRQIASKLAENDGFIAKILEKEERIKNQQDLPDDENAEEKETLTKAEEIALNKYRKTFWQLSGTKEFSDAFIKAGEFVKIYQKEGLEAIENPEIREIIKNYMED